MQVQYPLQEIRSLVPFKHVSPVYTIEQRSWCKFFKIEFMIPFPTYSVKATYLFMFIGFKVYVTVELALVQMLSSPPNALESDFFYGSLEEPKKLIPIAIYSFNCIFYARCGLGFTYQSQMPTQKA